MRIAITGSTGFLGTHILEEVKKREWEYAVLNRNRQELFDPMHLKRLVCKKDAIIHLAAVQRSNDLTEMYRVNVLGTKMLLDAILKFSPCSNFVFASSFHVYNPKTHFAYSKILAEEMIKSYAKGPEGFKTSIILRFTNLYGEGGKPFFNSVVATFAHQIKEGQQITVNGDGSQTRDYLYVSDAVAAIMKAVEFKHRRVETFDICTGRKITVNELLKLLQKCVQQKADVRYNEQSDADNWDINKNYKRAKRLLGWEPKIRPEIGLKRLFK
jgi:UDP-2-acetamido-2,6-beta-L-arabino-hexul-4-ose reductase